MWRCRMGFCIKIVYKNVDEGWFVKPTVRVLPGVVFVGLYHLFHEHWTNISSLQLLRFSISIEFIEMN
jgi:hypothetical protein